VRTIEEAKEKYPDRKTNEVLPYNKPRPYKKEYSNRKPVMSMVTAWSDNVQDELLIRMVKMRTVTVKPMHVRAKIIAHKRALSKGGSNKHGYKITSPSANRSFLRDSSKKLISEKSKRERKKT
jgi:hypothetical protein